MKYLLAAAVALQAAYAVPAGAQPARSTLALVASPSRGGDNHGSGKGSTGGAQLAEVPSDPASSGKRSLDRSSTVVPALPQPSGNSLNWTQGGGG